MKQRRFPLPISLLLLLAIAILYWKSPGSARMAAVENHSDPVVVTTEHTLAAPAPVPPPVVAAPSAKPIAAEQDAAEEVISIAAIMESTDPMKAVDMQRTVQKLRTLPSEQVSAYFMQSLKQLGPEQGVERDRLIMVANSLQSKTDLPLWEDLVKRQTPRYPDEEKVRNPPHPTLESRFIDMEQLQAIRNIGLIAREDRAARRILMEIILNPDPSAHRTLHREQAYIALKEADLAASLRVLKQLAAEDDLLKRL